MLQIVSIRGTMQVYETSQYRGQEMKWGRRRFFLKWKMGGVFVKKVENEGFFSLKKWKMGGV